MELAMRCPNAIIQINMGDLCEFAHQLINNAVKEIATLKGYDAVIDRASAQSMIYASPRIDISNEVLSKLGYSK